MSDWKARLGVVYSTNPDFNYDNGEAEEVATLPKQQQKLRVWADLDELSKLLKRKIGVGGSAKDGEIIIQGENRDRVLNILLAEGYSQTKKV